MAKVNRVPAPLCPQSPGAPFSAGLSYIYWPLASTNCKMSVVRFALTIDTQANNVSLDHQQRLQIEQIRAIEQSSKAYPNGHFSAPSVEAYLYTRAEHLKQSHQLSKPLAAAATRYSRLITIIMVIALIAGASTVLRAVENDNNTLNIFWILIVLLGFNAISLFIWLVLSMWPSSGIKSPSGNLFQQILTWLVSSSRAEGASLAASRTWLDWQLGSQAGRWLLGSIVHRFWLSFLVGGLAMLIVTLSTRQYDFVWGSTILNNHVFSTITSTLSIPMDWLNWPRPSTADLLASQVGVDASAQRFNSTSSGSETRALWGYFLIGCLALYGIVPRIVAWLTCLVLRKITLKKQALDLTAPYYLHLQNHWRSLSQRSLIIDEEVQHTQSHPSQQHHFSQKALPAKALWLGLELPQTIQAYTDQYKLLNIIDKATARQAMTALANTQLATVLLVNGGKPPDRGMTRQLQDLVKAKHQTSYWMVCALPIATSLIDNSAPPNTANHLNAWQDVANLLAIKHEHCTILEVADMTNKSSGLDSNSGLKGDADSRHNDGR